LLTAIRRLGLTATALARAQVGTIRLKLLKIGAVIWRNTRRIPFFLSSACPDKDLFIAVAQRLTLLSRAEGCWTFDARDRMPRPSRFTAHHLAKNARTMARAPSRESGFVVCRACSISSEVKVLYPA
jgi:hypothetical protein